MAGTKTLVKNQTSVLFVRLPLTVSLNVKCLPKDNKSKVWLGVNGCLHFATTNWKYGLVSAAVYFLVKDNKGHFVGGFWCFFGHFLGMCPQSYGYH